MSKEACQLTLKQKCTNWTGLGIICVAPAKMLSEERWWKLGFHSKEKKLAYNSGISAETIVVPNGCPSHQGEAFIPSPVK